MRRLSILSSGVFSLRVCVLCFWWRLLIIVVGVLCVRVRICLRLRLVLLRGLRGPICICRVIVPLFIRLRVVLIRVLLRSLRGTLILL